MVPRLALELELGDAAMKNILFLFCLLSTTAAFAQYGGSIGSISSQPQIYEFPSHAAHASYAPMAREQNNLGSSTFSFAQGERPASDFPQQATAAEAVSLGAVARELRQQHAQLKKSRVVWVNQ
jgi:hypothetical protein